MLTVLPQRAAATEQAERLAISADNTTVEVDVRALATFTIDFSRIRGEVVLSPRQPISMLLDFTVDMQSASSSPRVVARIAMGDKFLDAKQYREAVFASRKLEQTKEGGYQLLGELELHGVRRALAIPTELTIHRCELAMAAEFALNRRDFGVESDTTMDDLVADEVVVRIATRIRRSQADCQASKPEASASSS